MAMHLQNWTSIVGGKVSPHELYFRRKLNLGHFRLFDCIAYVHVPKEKRRSLDTKAKKCIFVSYFWYQPLTNPTPVASEPNTRDEVNEVEMVMEEEIGTLKEIPISFGLHRLSRLSEELSWNYQRRRVMKTWSCNPQVRS